METGIDIFGEEIPIEKETDDTVYKRKRVQMFDFLNDLYVNKKNILRQDPEAEKDFTPFIINRALSMGIDTVLYANEMNQNYDISKQMVYDFYIHALRSGKRYNKWQKPDKDKEVDMIQEYYEISLQKARTALALLTEEDKKYIKTKLQKGTVRK